MNIVIAATTICFCFITSTLSGNRSLTIIFIIFFFVLGFLNVLKIRQKTLKITSLSLIGALFILGILILFGVVKLPFKLAFLERVLDPAKNSDSARLELYMVFFKNFYKYPFGGLNTISELNYVHNIFLDMYTYGGLIPFVLFAAFAVDMAKKLSDSKDKLKISKGRYMLYLSLFVLTIGLGLFEPIYNANQSILSPLLIIYVALSYGAYPEKKQLSKDNFYLISI